ncbi:hypothetical protein PoB_005023200 [Plakobranchus ocellatus]|uniref:Zasp-like motif domain-containing protein n=1 Tax=Plakobranchus ocellatus TaxID=259542 RepID=A0AAV4BWL9_9GAST|nr:hypothetical protein PoB_005023200 [Plakobranchus ocellatus]
MYSSVVHAYQCSRKVWRSHITSQLLCSDPPGILKPVLQSAIANIPHQGYRRPVPQSDVANIPHQGYRRSVPQSVIVHFPHQGFQRPVPQSAVANIPHQGYRRPVPQSAIANNLTWLRNKSPNEISCGEKDSGPRKNMY